MARWRLGQAGRWREACHSSWKTATVCHGFSQSRLIGSESLIVGFPPCFLPNMQCAPTPPPTHTHYKFPKHFLEALQQMSIYWAVIRMWKSPREWTAKLNVAAHYFLPLLSEPRHCSEARSGNVMYRQRPPLATRGKFTPNVAICELNTDLGPSCQISQLTELEFKLTHGLICLHFSMRLCGALWVL